VATAAGGEALFIASIASSLLGVLGEGLEARARRASIVLLVAGLAILGASMVIDGRHSPLASPAVVD